MDQSIRALSEQVKFMTMNINMPSVGPPPQSALPSRGSPGASNSGQYGPGNQSHMNQPHHSQGNLGGMGGPHPNYSPSFQHPPPPPILHGQWYGQGMNSQPQMPSQPPPTAAQKNPSDRSEEWDDTYLAVLGTQDLKQLRELLARSNPEVIMPSNGAGPLSQAVILTLVHRVSQFPRLRHDRYAYLLYTFT